MNESEIAFSCEGELRTFVSRRSVSQELPKEVLKQEGIIPESKMWNRCNGRRAKRIVNI